MRLERPEPHVRGGCQGQSPPTFPRDVWGKKGSADANGLHVLVHRLRKELKEAGFDPWFIEKRRKAIRLALREVEIVGASSAD